MGKSGYTPKPKTPTYLDNTRQLAMKWLLILILCQISTVYADPLKLEIIELNNASVNQVLPLLRPFVEPGGTVTGMSNRLIVKTTPANLAEIKSILAELDQAPRQLRISVTQDIDQHRNFASDQLSGRVRLGDTTGQLGAIGPRGQGATIKYRDKHGNVIQYRGNRTRTNTEDHNLHFVTTLEGRQAFIFTGESTPYASQSYYEGPFGRSSQTYIDRVQTDRGFYVIPRIRDDMVTLEISTQLDDSPNPQDGSIDTRATNSVVTGKLGAWIPLGGASRQGGNNHSGLLASTRSHTDSAYDVWVRVEVVNP